MTAAAAASREVLSEGASAAAVLEAEDLPEDFVAEAAASAAVAAVAAGAVDRSQQTP